MKMRSVTTGLGLIFGLLFLALPSMAQTGHIINQVLPLQTPAVKTVKMPAMNFIAPGIVEVGSCKVDKKNGRVEFPARVNMQTGLLEYLLVGDSGKLHESLLSTDVSPYALQISLLLLGFEGSRNPLESQGEARTPEGDRVKILVRWREGQKTKTVALEKWLLKNKSTLKNVPWVFTGSIIREGVFMAEVERSIIAIFHDPTAMIDHQLQEGDNDQIWFVNSDQTPPKDTDVTIIIEVSH